MDKDNNIKYIFTKKKVKLINIGGHYWHLYEQYFNYLKISAIIFYYTRTVTILK